MQFVVIIKKISCSHVFRTLHIFNYCKILLLELFWKCTSFTHMDFWGYSEILLKLCQAWMETVDGQTSSSVPTDITVQDGTLSWSISHCCFVLVLSLGFRGGPENWIRFSFNTVVQSVFPQPWPVTLSQLLNDTMILHCRDGLHHLHAASLETRTMTILGWFLLLFPPFNIDQTQLEDISLLSFIHGEKHILSLRLTFCLSPQTQIVHFISYLL